jgi:hypothetical protein
LLRLKSIIGIILILTAVAGLAYWEIDGRERILTDQVLVARADIYPGQIGSSSLFETIGVTDEQKIKGVLEPSELESIIGQEIKQIIPAKAQISKAYFRTDQHFLKQGESIFVIRSEWISMVSSSIRKKDQIGIYTAKGDLKIGSYQVAFVKDSTVREVTNAYKEPDTLGGAQAQSSIGENSDQTNNTLIGNSYYIEPLERAEATSIVDHIEIITTLKGYQKILDITAGETPQKLLIVQE